MSSLRRIYRFMSSMNTGLGLLVLLGVASALGSTFLPDSFFNTRLFKLLMLLLLLNMTLCTANRLVGLKSLKNRTGWGRQGKKIGVLLLHAGIVMVLIGGTINTWAGHSVQIKMLNGDTVDVASFIGMQQPFSLRLDKFKIEFNDDGSPSQYYSSVSIIENGAVQRQQIISVNHPLQYSGIKAYQQSLGYLVRVERDNSSGEGSSDLLEEGEIISLPGTQRKVKIYRYIPNFDPALGMNTGTMRPDNPRIVFSVYENNELLGVGAAQFGEKVTVDEGIDLAFTGVEPYTVLKVKSDPGLPVAASGGILFMIGVTLSVLFAPGKKPSLHNS